ncbi:MAG: hypothetical protein AAF623_03985 [Planctomycetota bacterium]
MRTTHIKLLGLLFWGATAVGNAQEIETEIQEVETQSTQMTVIAGDEMAAPMIFSTTESFSDGNGTGSIRMFAAPGGTMSFSGGLPMMNRAPDPFSLLNNPSVQKDLELVGDQLKQVQDMQAAFAEQMREQIGDITKDGIQPDRLKGIGEMVKKIQEEQREKMEALLLPHQRDRLRQVALQTYMQSAGAANALGSDAVAEELNITDEQKERLKKRQKEIKEKLAEDIEKLKKKAKDELLMELNADQRAKLKEMVGDEYKPQNKDWIEKFENLKGRVPKVKFNRGN